MLESHLDNPGQPALGRMDQMDPEVPSHPNHSVIVIIWEIFSTYK